MVEELKSDIVFTGAVKDVQRRLGSRAMFERMERTAGWQSEITKDLAVFIAARDSLYLAPSSADAQPHVQHRSGSKGFLKVLDRQTLALADLKGNQQYLSVRNFSENNKAFVSLMDYPHRRRVKLWGRARFVEYDPALLAQFPQEANSAGAQRVLLFSVLASDVNCIQNITPCNSEDDIAQAITRLQQRITKLETEVATLRAQLDSSAGEKTV